MIEILTLNPITFLEQLALVFAKSESGPTMHAHKFINYELKFHIHSIHRL